jgi:hypothetical protein
MAKVGVGVSEKELRGGREGREGVLLVIKTKTSRQDMTETRRKTNFGQAPNKLRPVAIRIRWSGRVEGVGIDRKEGGSEGGIGKEARSW